MPSAISVGTGAAVMGIVGARVVGAGVVYGLPGTLMHTWVPFILSML